MRVFTSYIIHQCLSLSLESRESRKWLLYQSNVGLSGLLCLCPSQALGQERGVCSGMCVGTHIPVYACTCGSSLRTHPEAAAWVLVGTESCAFKCYSKATPLFFFYADVKIMGLGAQDKVAVIQSCPGFPGPPGPKGEPGSPAGRGSNLDGKGFPFTSPWLVLLQSYQENGTLRAAQERWDLLAAQVRGNSPMGLTA